jgi:hypothetical protein
MVVHQLFRMDAGGLTWMDMEIVGFMVKLIFRFIGIN